MKTASDIVTEIRKGNDQSGVGKFEIEALLAAGKTEAEILAMYGAYSGSSGMKPEQASEAAGTELVNVLAKAHAGAGHSRTEAWVIASLQAVAAKAGIALPPPPANVKPTL